MTNGHGDGTPRIQFSAEFGRQKYILYSTLQLFLHQKIPHFLFFFILKDKSIIKRSFFPNFTFLFSMANIPSFPCIQWLSEQALEVRFGETIDVNSNENVHQFASSLQQNLLHGVIDIMPTYLTVLVRFDVTIISTNLIEQWVLHRLYNLRSIEQSNNCTIIQIPTYYGVMLGSDLPALSKLHKISIEEIVNLHSKPIYKVYMLGYLPGFAYMGEVNPAITFARKQQPVPTPAGAVAIAGKQTGIYPCNSPGGWQIIGFTPIQMFNLNNTPCCLLQPGDQVQFIPIDFSTYQHILAQKQSYN